MMLTCKQATRLVSQGLDRELAFGERVALHLHLAVCLGCRRARSQVRFVRKAVRKLVEIDLKTNL